MVLRASCSLWRWARLRFPRVRSRPTLFMLQIISEFSMALQVAYNEGANISSAAMDFDKYSSRNVASRFPSFASASTDGVEINCFFYWRNAFSKFEQAIACITKSKCWYSYQNILIKMLVSLRFPRQRQWRFHSFENFGADWKPSWPRTASVP